METKLENSATFEKLRRAFFEEAGLAYRYLFFATVADFEGLDRHAAIFRELAEGGTMSVQGCLDFLRTARDPSSDIPIGGTRKNLESLLQTELEQSSESYPAWALLAREEGFTDIASWFDTLEKLKRIHVKTLSGLQNEK